MKCAVIKTIRTKKPCVEEAVTRSPYSGSPICAACADEVDQISILLNQLSRLTDRESAARPLINYQGRN